MVMLHISVCHASGLFAVLPFFREAWNMAGNMPKEEAMLNYVEELQKVHLLCVCMCDGRVGMAVLSW